MTLLFVYGTLQPGEVRWQHLAPYVIGDGRAASVAGHLYDTGLQYPAAMFGDDGHIVGRVYPLDDRQLAAALEHLDGVEGAVRGLYSRVSVVTSAGETSWAYECGEPELLRTRIHSGDWLQREPSVAP